MFCLAEFLRVTTHPRLFDPPFTAMEAAEALERVFESASLTIIGPGAHYPAPLIEAVPESKAVGNSRVRRADRRGLSRDRRERAPH